MNVDDIVDPTREFFLGLASIFNALHELPDAMPQKLRRRARVGFLFNAQGEGNLALLPSDIARIVDGALGDVPDAMGQETIEAAYEALQAGDRNSPALAELRRRLGSAQGILDGEDAAQALREMPFRTSKS